MLPICIVNAETMDQVPAEVRQYLRDLRRRIIELEQTPPQQRIAELESANRGLQVQLEDAQTLIAQLQAQIHLLQQQLGETTAKLNTNSTNSSLPPSSDRFHGKRRPPTPADQPRKKRGGQPRHPRQQRPLVPPDQVQQTIPCKPTACRRCGKPLTGNDPEPLRHQVAELPVVRPDIIEYQLHRLSCPCCHISTCGTLPPQVQGHFGPRLQATLALLAGRFRLGLRPVVELAGDLWGLTISTGMVSKLRQRTAEALLLPWVQVAMYVRNQNTNIDETTWRENKKRVYLWAAVTKSAVLYRIARGRTAKVAREILGAGYSRVATCDRLKSYWWIKRLQWCWAHLRRDFQAMIDRGNSGKKIGEELLEQSNKLFHLWHEFREGKRSRSSLQESMKPVQEAVKQLLLQGQKSGCEKTAGTCKELLSHEEWLWTFVKVEGVEPTNNAAEQAERQGVMWRKISQGTDSEQGSRFVERVLTVIETCRRQGKQVLAYLCACIESWTRDDVPPDLVLDTS
jgi:transposase